MSMRLWLWYAPGTDEQIAAACETAAEELAERGVAIDAAFAAAVVANASDDDQTIDYDPAAVAAWYTAEFAALTRLFELTGQWPTEGALIVIDE